MNYFYILPSYISWHYGEAYKDIVRVWTNFLWFVYNFFSLPLLMRTFFSPWQRLQEKRKTRGLNLEETSEVIFVNIVMRFVGAFVRSIFIAIGSVFTIIVFWLGVVFFVVWTFLPVLIILSFVYSLSFFV